MMEMLTGYPSDIFAAVWHDPLHAGDNRAALPPDERDRLAGPHDVRILAKYARGAKPVSTIEIAEHSMLGMGQWRDFGRIAVITDDRTVRHTVQFLAPFFHGPVRVFANGDAREARVWIEQHDHH
ncbi:MAG TPA: STAS/SEC14 domain-containing protein [Rhizomicrobium sp.]|jgi:hypothetical protein|nr:STAS/SEC14 domain-containing protein [Rhizomicrobium sp.]